MCLAFLYKMLEYTESWWYQMWDIQTESEIHHPIYLNGIEYKFFEHSQHSPTSRFQLVTYGYQI